MSGRRIPRVAFVCVRNSCRSQMAEALARALCSDSVEAFSAGTDPAEGIDPAAADVVREVVGVDMVGGGQRPKPLAALPEVDAVVTMGCGAECPSVTASLREDWGLDDPAGGPREGYLACLRAIGDRMPGLVARLEGLGTVEEGGGRWA